jgi:hypothetical protein
LPSPTAPPGPPARLAAAWAVALVAARGAVAAVSPAAAAPELAWKTLQPGVEYAVVTGAAPGGVTIEGRLHVVRIEPARAPLLAAMASSADRQPRTAAAWCRARRLAVAINLGMYRTDHLTNVGHAHAPGHANNAAWSSSYKSALAFAPSKKGIPGALLVDLDAPGGKDRLAPYGAVVQNLRLIRAPGQSVWGQQGRRWSEAAVAMDRQGRVLFIFIRHPYAMQDLNAKLLALPLGITTAMHVEGGPEASLSIHTGGVDVDLNGSYETGFNENDGESAQWRIPNVLGVARP